MGVSSVFLAAVVVCHVTLITCGGVDTDWMNQTLTQHFSHPRHHVTGPQYKQQTMMFIRDQFRDMGLETHIHTFPTLLDNVTGVNVIGVLKGRHFNTPQDRVAGIGAHYDTMRDTPGVNDNGAGVVVMLQAARELSLHPDRNYTLLFVAFDFEEYEQSTQPQVACGGGFSLCGSSHLVSSWIPNFWTQPVGWRGIFVMDTILNFDGNTTSQRLPLGLEFVFPAQTQDVQSDGGRGDFLVTAGRPDDQLLLHVFNTSWDRSGPSRYEVESFTLPEVSEAYRDFLRSDHYSFWQADLAAVFLTDTANFRGYMSGCYHSPCDDLRRVTAARLDFAAKTCRSLIATLDTLAPRVEDDGSNDKNGQRQCTDGASPLSASLSSTAISLLLWSVSMFLKEAL